MDDFYDVYVCPVCDTQCDPDLHWGCQHRNKARRMMVRSSDLLTEEQAKKEGWEGD